MTTTSSTIKVVTSQVPSTITDPNSIPSCDKSTRQGCERERAWEHENWLGKNTFNVYTNTHNRINLLTLIDSGASDHCFANKSLFTTLTPLKEPTSGMSAGKGSIFRIIGEGYVEFDTEINGVKKHIMIDNILYTPELQSNLISVSKLGAKGATVTFNAENAIVKLQNGTEIMSAIRLGQLYAVNVSNLDTDVFTTQSKGKSVPFNTWYHQFAHAGVETICTMILNNLVDELDIDGKPIMEGQC